MKQYKVAVCLSGEARTFNHAFPSFLDFFKSDRLEVHYFGHTWTNSFFNKDCKNKINNAEYNLNYDPSKLKNDLNSIINFDDLMIENRDKFKYNLNGDHIFQELDKPFPIKNAANLKRPYMYDQMSYSIMMANELKTNYELKNYMQFDLVVRARFDICFNPNFKFEDMVTRNGPIYPTALYCDTHYFSKEHFYPNVNDIFYYGSSTVMNTVDGFYRYFGNGKFWEMTDQNWFDPVLKVNGYNINLYKWLTLKNIIFKQINVYQNMTIYRMTAVEQNLTYPTGYKEIFEIDRSVA
jgi:hypothetical protein